MVNVGDTVFVRWYGSVVEGKLLNGEHLGMKQVQIKLDGHKIISLFSTKHIYNNVADALAVEPTTKQSVQHIIPSTEIPTCDYFQQQLQEFKESHWDYVHNHLQVEAVEEFYELWKAWSSPLIKIKIDGADIEQLAKEFANFDGVIYNPDAKPTIMLEPNQETAPQKKSKQNPTVTQLSLFD